MQEKMAGGLAVTHKDYKNKFGTSEVEVKVGAIFPWREATSYCFILVLAVGQVASMPRAKLVIDIIHLETCCCV